MAARWRAGYLYRYGNKMRVLIILLFCIFLFSACQPSKTGCLIKITDKEHILEDTEADDIWDCGALNRSEFEKAIKQFFRTHPERIIAVEPKYILKHLSEYAIEYAGVVQNGKKYILCQMVLDWGNCLEAKNSFSFILDGGCSVVDVYYDPKEQKIISIFCNGVA